MAGLGRKTFNSGDVLNAADVQGYLMDQAVMVFDGTASRGSAIPTPSAGMVAYSTATQLQVYNGSAWVGLSTGYGAATGGTSSSITVGGVAYTLLTFTGSGTLTVTKAGLFDLIILGGGGSGGKRATVASGGGGGAGGMLLTTAYFDANQTLTVGAKGAARTADSNGLPGGYSAIDRLGVDGGEGGFGAAVLKDGGCGGGAGLTSELSFAVIPTQGKDGGVGNYPTTDAAAGGGGLGAVGGNAVGSTAGNGGAGYDYGSFIGAGSTLFGGGGGGSSSGTSGTGGTGGGGNGGATGSNATSYGAGGGGSKSGNSGAGSDGLILVRFKS
jgi:hypothetical protein